MIITCCVIVYDPKQKIPFLDSRVVVMEIVTLLLEAGADPYIENEMDLNSFDITKKFGPFPSVMGVLNKNKNN